MKKKNSQRIGNLSLAFALLFLFSSGHTKAETEKGQTMSPTIEKSTALTVAQQSERTIKGVVKDATGETIVGANVSVVGTTIGTITDMDGAFSLKVPAGATLKFSFIGYKDASIKINNQQTLNVVLKDDSQALDEVVVVGFGSQKRVNLTGAVSTVKAEALEARPVTNVGQALQGVVPGLNFSVPMGGGELDNNMKFNIRGIGSIGAGSKSEPLVLIDGMEGNMNALNPQDIETISVLKDAAASSIYGSRAPFGVILITTKSGKAGKVSINYNNNVRFSDPTKVPDMMDSYTFAQYFNAASSNGGTGAKFNQDALDRIVAYQKGELLDGTIADNQHRWQEYGGANGNTNWFDEHYRHWTPSHEHNLSVNGGSEKVTYMLSGNFMDERGLLKHSDDSFKRYSLNAKLRAEVTKYLTVNYTSRWIRNDYDKSYYQNALFFHNLARRWPTIPVKDPNGHYMPGSEIIQLESGSRDKKQNDDLTQQLQIVLEPIKNWKITAEANMKVADGFRHYDVLPTYEYNSLNEPRLSKFDEDHAAGITEVYESADRRNFYTVNAFTDYFYQTKSGHYIKGMLGFNAELNRYRSLYASRQALISPSLPTLDTATDMIKNGGIGSNSYNEWATAGFFGRINYNYQERYMVEVNMRYDGTSRFIGDQRWGFFPSFSAGWNIAREAFWSDFEPYVSTLKLRGSWGELGNQNTSELYPFYPGMTIKASDSNWLINNLKPNTAQMPGMVSDLMTWERVRSWNIGLDFGALNNRLTGSFDYFNRQTIDMVGPAPELPIVLGANVPKINNADMESYGFELEVSWRDRIGNVDYGVKGILSDARQKVTRYPNTTNKYSNWYAGKMSGEIWGYTTLGIAKSQEEMDAHLATLPNGGQTALGSDWGAGDIMYADLDGDGKIDSGADLLTNAGDKKIIGNNTPRYNFGLTLDAAYKGFDFSVFFQGVGKREVEVGGPYFWGVIGNEWQSAGFKDHWDFFRPEGDPLGANLDAYYPRPLMGDGSKYQRNQKTQTGYLQNGAYIRMKNIQVGYTFPKRWMEAIKIQSLRVYVSGDNLLTMTKMAKMFDPEAVSGRYNWDNAGAYGDDLNNNGKVYPLSKVISFGINVNF
ncbi:MAG: TonB-dependent receptor [Tannerellaceae bacterium]